MTMRTIRIGFALCLAVALGGCATVKGQASRAPTPVSSATVPAAIANVTLVISNQSFLEPNVRIDVRIDGEPVVDGAFPVEGQHSFFSYPLKIRPGRHELTARTTSGVRTAEAFDVSEAGSRYGVLNYWNYEGEPKRFTWTFQAEPPVFG